MTTMTVQRSVRIADGLKIATLVFSDGTVIDRFVVRPTAGHAQFEVYDNMSGSLMYSRATPASATQDVAILNEMVTKDNDHEE